MKWYWKRSKNISSISPVLPTEITIVTSLFSVILTTLLLVAAASSPEARAFPWPFGLLRSTTWAVNRVQEECLPSLTIQVIAPPSHGWELCTHPFFNCLALEFPLRPALVPQIPTSFLPSVKTHKFLLFQDFIAIYVGCTGCCHTLPGSRLRRQKHSLFCCKECWEPFAESLHRNLPLPKVTTLPVFTVMHSRGGVAYIQWLVDVKARPFLSTIKGPTSLRASRSISEASVASSSQFNFCLVVLPPS